MLDLSDLVLTPEQERALKQFQANHGERAEAAAATTNMRDFISLMLPSYIPNKVSDLLCENLDAVHRRELQKLIVCIQPRSGKTDHCVIYNVAYEIGKEANMHGIITSYGDNRAWEISQKSRDVVNNASYPFDTRLNRQVKGSQRWWTTNGGEINAAGLTGSLTGKGASRFWLDDPIKDWEEATNPKDREAKWNGYLSVVKTRLERFRAAPTFIIPATRWHDDDLVGRILNSSEANEWKVISVPALATPSEDQPDPFGRLEGEALLPELGFSREFMESTRDSYLEGEGGGPDIWYALYQQDPVPRGGGMFKADKWGRWSNCPHDNVAPLPPLVRVEHLYDTSFGQHATSDFTAFSTVGRGVDGNFYWLDMGKKRMQFPERVAHMEAKHRADRRRPIVVEYTHSAIDAVAFLRARGNRVIEWNHHNKDKIAIAEPVAHWQENGRCFLPEGHPAVPGFIDEHARFPKGKYDDLVTVTCMALERLAKFRARQATGVYAVSETQRQRMEGDFVLADWNPFGTGRGGY